MPRSKTLDEMTLDELGAHRAQLRQETETVTTAIRQRVVDAITAGELTEAEAARRTRVDRMIIRKWLGKGPR
jgi:transposase